MPNSEPSAESIFAQYLERIEAGENPSFETICLEHPGQADDLRAMLSDQQLLADAVEQAFPSSFSFFGRQAEVPPPPFTGIEPGRVIGDFKLLRPIGQGGMGQVWEAEQISLGRHVAFKIVRPDRVSARTLDLFAREARAGGRLHHPGIVAVHSHGEDEGIAWIAMELVDGAWSLQDFIVDFARREEIPDKYYRDVASLIAQIADALHAAHTAGIIHRDLKPQNILVTPSDKPKLTDFGLARITDETALSQTGDFAGTYYYMSPEQVAARRAGIDHRTDVFSLGIVMYEMLAQRRPFEGDSSHQVANQIMVVDPPDLRRVRSRIPRELAVICAKALEKDRHRRFDTMQSMSDDINRFLSDRPILSRPPSRLRKLQLWVKRNPTKSLAASLAAIGVAVTAHFNLELRDANTALAHQKDKAELQEAEAVLQSYIANLAAANLALSSGELSEARRRLGSAAEKHRGWEWEHLNLLSDNAIHVASNHGSWVRKVAFDSSGLNLHYLTSNQFVRTTTFPFNSEPVDLGVDSIPARVEPGFTFGNHLQAGSKDGACVLLGRTRWIGDPDRGYQYDPTGDLMVLVDTATKREMHTFPVSSSDFQNVTFSDDGRLIATRTQEGIVTVWGCADGNRVLLLDGQSGTLHGDGQSLAFSPDGKALAIAGDELSVADCVTKESLFKAKIRCTSVRYSHNGNFLAASKKNEEKITVLDATSGELLSTIDVGEGIYSIALSPDDKTVAVGLADYSIRLYQVTDGKRLSTLRGHAGHVNCIDFDPTGMFIASGSSDGTMRVWSTHDTVVRSIVRRHNGSDTALVAGGRFVLTDTTSAIAINGLPVPEERTYLWDSETGTLIRSESFQSSVEAVAGNSTDDRAAVGLADGTISIFRAESGDRLASVSAHDEPVRSLVFDLQGSHLASADTEGNISICEANTGKLVRKYPTLDPNLDWYNVNGRLPFHGSRAFAWSPDGTTVGATSGGNEICLMTPFAETPPRRIHLDWRNGSSQGAIAFHPDGKSLFVGGAVTGEILMIELATGEVVATLRGHSAAVESITFLPSNRRLVTGSSDRTVRVWSSEPPFESLVQLRPEVGKVGFLGTSVDGARLFAGGSHVKVMESERLPLETLAALEFPDARRTNARSYNSDSWEIVQASDRTESEYADALRWATRAAELDPSALHIRNTLGVAHFRVGSYQEALDLLLVNDRLNQSEFEYSRGYDLLFVAMCQHRLGRPAEAKATLQIARSHLNSNDESMLAFVEEAEQLIGKD